MVSSSTRDAQCEPHHTHAQHRNSYIATAYFKQATALLTRGLYGEAESYFREVLRLWPDHAGGAEQSGHIRLAAGPG